MIPFTGGWQKGLAGDKGVYALPPAKELVLARCSRGNFRKLGCSLARGTPFEVTSPDMARYISGHQSGGLMRIVMGRSHGLWLD